MTKLLTYRKIATWLLGKCRNHWLQIVLNILLGTSYVMSSLAFVWATKLSVDIATHSVEGNINVSIAFLVGIMAIEIALGFSSKWVRAVLGVKARNKMQETIFKRLLNAEWLGLKRLHSGDVINRVMQDVNVVVNLITEDIPSFLTTLVQLVGAFAFMYIMDSRLAIIVLCIAPLFVVLSKLYIKKLRKLTHEVRELESTVQSCIQESLQHSLVVKTLERVDYVTGRLVGNHQRLQRKVVEKTWYGSVSQFVMNVGFGIGYLVTFVWGVKKLEAGLITYGALTAFVQLVGQIQHPIRTLTRFVPVFISAFTATERLKELEEIPLEDLDKTAAEQPSNDSTSSCCTIRFVDVSYSYAPGSREVISDFSYEFNHGDVVAVVGETGAGKTTLIRLLLALVRPTKGRILLGTQEISAADRRSFTYVPQGNTLLSGTLRNNLLMGNPQATDQELWEVLDVASADFVKSLPDGLDTECGEMGAGFSEGQAQRLCIARALLRKCPVMLFDESTSALDETTEKKVVDNIIRYSVGSILIFVTHRPNILDHCNKMLQLSRPSC